MKQVKNMSGGVRFGLLRLQAVRVGVLRQNLHTGCGVRMLLRAESVHVQCEWRLREVTLPIWRFGLNHPSLAPKGNGFPRARELFSRGMVPVFLTDLRPKAREKRYKSPCLFSLKTAVENYGAFCPPKCP